MEDRKGVTSEQLSVVKRAKSFSHAGRGLWLFVKTTPNAWIHLVIFTVAIAAGFWFSITTIEWALLIIMGTMVLAAEAFNTAIEIDMDLTSPEYHPYARDTKDVAAAAVLITAIAAIATGFLIFGRYLL